MTTMPSAAAGSAVSWRLWVGPLVWAAHFLAIYAFTALACSRNVTTDVLGVSVVGWFIGTATLLAAAVLGVTIWLAVRDGTRAASLPAPSGFVHWLTAAVASMVLLAVVWETLPVLFVPICS